MWTFIIRRLIQSVIVIIGVTLITFTALQMSGDPTYLYVSERATEAEIQRTREALGFDRPLPEQYLTFLGNLLQGDFGNSLSYKRPAIEAVMEALRELGAELGPGWTRSVPLYGGTLSRPELLARAADGPASVSLATRQRWALTYGDRIEALYARVSAEPALAMDIAPGVPRVELDYAAVTEDAMTAEDFLLRRTKLHLLLDAAGRDTVEQWFVTST